MPGGLIVLCLITLSLAAGLVVLGRRLLKRDEPLPRVRSPGGGLVADPDERLAATRRMGRSALWIAAALVVLTGIVVAQEWRAGRIGAVTEARRLGQ